MAPTVFEVWYRAEYFGPEIDGTYRLTLSTDDLAHALFTTGRAPADQARHGNTSVWEWLHRTSLIPAYIRRSYNGRLIRSGLALELDRSEKVAISYALGQAMTGIFSRQVLSVTYLMHIDRYSNRYRVVFSNTRKRPDLFGRRSSGWVVAEAKGRSGAVGSDILQKIAAQKRSIRSIEGLPPELAYGCISSFPPDTGALRIDAVDPMDNDEEAIDLDVDIDRFILAYYEPYLVAVDFDEDDDDDLFEAARIASFGVRVGLLRPIAERIRRARAGQLAGLYESVREILASVDRGMAIFPDGSIFRTEWDESLFSYGAEYR